MTITNIDLRILNAASGITIILVLAIILNRNELAFTLLMLSATFIIMGFGKEGFMLTKTEYQPLIIPSELRYVERSGLAILFFLNIIILLIYWFPLPFPGPDAAFGEAVTALLVFGGFPMLVLYLDFERLGKALARNKYMDSDLT